MTESKRLSIIIPFYNVEKYIARCLDSVVKQDIPYSDYEIICVNDASPDSSRKIVQDYIKKYPNIKLIEHSENRKLGTARNTGRSIAEGDYIWNVDSDDWIEHNCLSKLIGICEKENLDVLTFNGFNTNCQKFIPIIERTFDTNCMTGLDFFRSIDDNISLFCPVWKQIYKKSFLDENNIYSPEVNQGEDVPFSLQSFISAKRVKYFHQGLYYHLCNNVDSLSNENKTYTASELYEKSFVNAKLIFNILPYIPKDYSDISTRISEIAKYVILCANKHKDGMCKSEITAFRKLCRLDFSSNFKLAKELLSKKQLCKYLLNVLI